MDNLSVRMIHDNLEQTPTFDCPEPYRILPYRSGWEDDWLRIHERSDQLNVFTPFVFVDQFGRDSSLLADRQFYLVDAESMPVGTATAWVETRGAHTGRVHWVAILPEHQGKGLAKPLLTTVCQKLLSLGHRKGCLSTSTARIPAISLYLRFGFRPLIQSDEDELSWSIFERHCGFKLP
jgi:GNAT superfamily N-acetyltransferase